MFVGSLLVILLHEKGEQSKIWKKAICFACKYANTNVIHYIDDAVLK